MVRINLINPKCLTDQHLIAEYNEILMLIGYVKKYPKLENIPEVYTLGKGHMRFFKNKLKYLKNRHELIKKEMKERGFKPTISIDIEKFNKKYLHNFKPKKEDLLIIKQRIRTKLKTKPTYYRYYGKHLPLRKMIGLLENSV